MLLERAARTTSVIWKNHIFQQQQKMCAYVNVMHIAYDGYEMKPVGKSSFSNKNRNLN